MSFVSDAGLRLEFCADPSEFLASAGKHLAAEPVVNTVVTSVAHRVARYLADGVAQPEHDWWLAVRDASGAVVGAAMRTAPFAPYLLPMPDEAAVALARALHARGEEVLGVKGALPATELFAAELTRLAGGTVQVSEQLRLHELGSLMPPAPVSGHLVDATEDDVELVTQWLAAFHGDANEQAGRPRGSGHDDISDISDRAATLRRLQARQLCFWVDSTGEPVHLTGFNPPSFGVARIGPVYTPPAQRGRGWAANAVAEVSRKLQAEGARVCLFTDLANPTSNKLYVALGYEPVADMANIVIDR